MRQTCLNPHTSHDRWCVLQPTLTDLEFTPGLLQLFDYGLTFIEEVEYMRPRECDKHIGTV